MIERSRQLLTPLLYLAALVLLTGLARFAAAGLSTRYWADDFCYSAVIAAGGFLRGPVDWFMASGNRFSTIYLVGLQDLFGPASIRFVPGLVLLSLAAGWLLLLRAASRALGLKRGFLVLLPFGLAQVFFLALLAPDRLQALYWRMGALHYTFPLALLLAGLAIALNVLPAPRLSPAAAGSLLLAFFAAGFSETFAALQAGAFALALALAWVLLPPGSKGRSLRAFLPPLLGGLLAMGLMLLSPSNAWRQAALPPPASLGQFLATTLRYTFDFTLDTLRGAPLPLLALALTSAASAYLAVWSAHPRPPAVRPLLTAAAIALLAGLALAACAVAPSVYAGLQFPAGRALMPARFALLLGWSGAAAGLAGLARRPALPPRTADALLLFSLLAGSFYLVRHLSQPLPEQAGQVAWAARWDERDAAIRAARSAGELDLVLPEVEVVRGLEDLGPDPAHWVNRCAAAYYRVRSITAHP